MNQVVSKRGEASFHLLDPVESVEQIPVHSKESFESISYKIEMCLGSWRRANCSVRFTRFPHLFARPPAGPLNSDEGITRDCSHGRPYLDQILDLEARTPEQPYPVAMRQMKLDA